MSTLVLERANLAREKFSNATQFNLHYFFESSSSRPSLFFSEAKPNKGDQSEESWKVDVDASDIELAGCYGAATLIKLNQKLDQVELSLSRI